MLARDATYLISLAAEEFIRKLAESSQRVAEREKRATVQQKDVGTNLMPCFISPMMITYG